MIQAESQERQTSGPTPGEFNEAFETLRDALIKIAIINHYKQHPPRGKPVVTFDRPEERDRREAENPQRSIAYTESRRRSVVDSLLRDGLGIVDGVTWAVATNPPEVLTSTLAKVEHHIARNNRETPTFGGVDGVTYSLIVRKLYGYRYLVLTASALHEDPDIRCDNVAGCLKDLKHVDTTRLRALVEHEFIKAGWRQGDGQISSTTTNTEPIVDTTVEEPPIRLDRWAIGVNPEGSWFLFERFYGKGRDWTSRGNIHIPNGRARKLAEKLADEGGAISRNDAAGLFRDDRRGFDTKKILDSTVKHGLQKLRKCILDAIKLAKGMGEHKKIKANPIEHSKQGGGWKSVIEIGFVEKDDKSRLVFKTREILNAERELSLTSCKKQLD